jgi:hypothetical protein
VETRQVQSGRDLILELADRANPLDAIAELIWNALDAEATNVEVTVSVGDLGAPEEIVVRDDGTGMTYQQALNGFLVDGESWKKHKKFSPNIRRPMHGRLGRGRFLCYALVDRVEWRSVVSASGEKLATTIVGNRSMPNRYDFDGPRPCAEEPGTTVTLQARQDQKAARLADSGFVLPLTARLASTLLALTDVSVTYRSVPLDPREHVEREVQLAVELGGESLRGHEMPRLVVVEWARDMRSRKLYLCDEHGTAATEHRPERMPPVPIHWTAYLHWSGFGDPALMGVADLHHPEVQHAVLLAAADKAIAEYLSRRLDEQRGHLIQQWIAEGVYPYVGGATSPAEEIERDLFDVVAVVASPGVARDTRAKKLSLRLLREALRSEPVRTRKILEAVLSLTEEEQDVLAELLDRTRLTAVIKAAQTIADREDFVRGLGRLLFSDETRRIFREVDQLHPMLVREPWIFGDEWTLSLSESGLTGVVKAALDCLGEDVEFASEPVLLPSGKKGRVDMVFYRTLPESEGTRHLVVELKRPMRLTTTEWAQLNNYATAITDHPQVATAPHQWDFWLVGTDLDAAVKNLLSNASQPGLTTTAQGGRYRLWVVTWGQLLDRANRRLEAFRQALEIVSTDETSREYLNRAHAEFIPTDADQPGTPR